MKDPVFRRMHEYNLNLLPNEHLQTLENGVTSIDAARARTGATIGFPGWGLLYHILLCHLDRAEEAILVETGSNYGCTTIILAQALIDANCDGKVLTFELDPNNLKIARENWKHAKVFERIKSFEGDVRDTFPNALRGLKNLRFAFLDASHLIDDVLFEFETILPHLAPDALVLFDNTYKIASDGENSRVNGALQIIKEKFGGNLINLEHVSWYTPGLAIWQQRPNL